MNVLRLMGAGVVECALAIGIGADAEKDNPQLVVGRWSSHRA